jgi:hypothetical protein
MSVHRLKPKHWSPPPQNNWPPPCQHARMVLDDKGEYCVEQNETLENEQGPQQLSGCAISKLQWILVDVGSSMALIGILFSIEVQLGRKVDKTMVLVTLIPLLLVCCILERIIMCSPPKKDVDTTVELGSQIRKEPAGHVGEIAGIEGSMELV